MLGYPRFTYEARTLAPLSIPCPKCGFSLIVTNRRILGRPARCPQCDLKFILEEPEPEDEATIDFPARVEAKASRPGEETVLSEDLLVDQGRVYVSMEQIKSWHSKEEEAKFLRWIMYKTTALAADGMGFFLEDYDEWLGLGMPDSK
ncbi:MAG: hypothetical protein HOL01_04015 [Planctomycetaceae bacterium]|jgi:hypothetical protein|nr:hypothetical protein [Planctomycetaceae bacterium]MBT6487304.1 hypothetical protein [Planctomycetaceae bacterium]MBT6493701.1 hypothetical protein [Planctomycetaceae bacterium]